MLYRLLADAIVLIHMAFVIFVATGGFLVRRWPRLAWLHVPAAMWGAAIAFAGQVCPLTPLEIWLRHTGGEAGYAGTFVDQYVLPILYPVGLTRLHQAALGTGVVVINAIAYGLLLYERSSSKSAQA